MGSWIVFTIIVILYVKITANIINTKTQKFFSGNFSLINLRNNQCDIYFLASFNDFNPRSHEGSDDIKSFTPFFNPLIIYIRIYEKAVEEWMK